jgi:hypothetical protein
VSPRQIAALILPATLIAATVAAASSTTLRVTSSLDGKTVLPHRISWMAYSTIPTFQIKEIDYLIDGKLRWIGHASRSTYSDTGGYLVTSWLKPGLHKFTVRTIALNGKTASDTVAARVLPAPVPPAALVGSWQRTVNTSDAPPPGSSGNPTDTDTPSGTYTITFSRKWIEDHFPGKFTISGSINDSTGDGFELLTDWTPKPTTFHVAGSISIQPFDGNTDQLGGSWCYWGGPAADYTWKVSGTRLTLKPSGGEDPCSIRGFIWTGTWTKIAAATGRLP